MCFVELMDNRKCVSRTGIGEQKRKKRQTDWGKLVEKMNSSNFLILLGTKFKVNPLSQSYLALSPTSSN